MLVIAAGGWIVSNGFDRVPKALAQGMQPAAYPKLLCLVLALLGIAMAAEAIRHRQPARSAPPVLAPITAVLLLAAICLVPWIGVPGAMVLVCAIMPLLWGQRRHWITTLFAILFPACVYLLFWGVLEVRFPLGVFARFL
jgi:putative tricarboxylic transport membrane protein